MKLSRFIILALPLLAACSSDGYETGDSALSYMRADFVEAHTVASGQFDSALTDDGESLTLSPQATASWASKADTTYRALLYYNKVEGESTVQPIQMVRVIAARYARTERSDTLKTDPVTFQSMWRSKNGKYLNIGLYVKTGADGEGSIGIQTLGMRLDSVGTAADGGRVAYITLTHNQNNVPQYYSSRAYVSLPLEGDDRQSSFHVTINTYSGRMERDI